MDSSKFEEQLRKLDELWGSVEIPSLGELLSTVDEAIMKEIRGDLSGAALTVFTIFNTPTGLVKSRMFRPLNPREFLEYWMSLTDEEKQSFAIYPEGVK